MMTMMATFLGEIDRHARECYDEGAGLTLRPLDPEADAPLLQRWFAMDYARFWSMQGPQRGAGARLLRRAVRQWPCPGLARFAPGPPAFLVECYDPPTTNWRALPRASGRHRHAHLHRSAHATHPGLQPRRLRPGHALPVRPAQRRPRGGRAGRQQRQDPCAEPGHGFRLRRAGPVPRKPPASPSAPAPNSSRPNFRSPPYEPPRHATSVPGRQPP